MDIETIWDNDIAKALCISITSNNKIEFKIIEVNEIDDGKIVEFLIEKCNNNKTYYVHNLTFETFVFLGDMIKKNIKFKVISNNKSVYCLEIFYKNKKIIMKCSYKLTMLPLKKLAEICGVEQKTIFPYSILNRNLEKIIKIDKSMFKDNEEYEKFKKTNGEIINTYKILEEYCKNDAYITKKSIIAYWKILEENGLKKKKNMLTAAKVSIENYFNNNKIVKKKIDIKIDRLIRNGYFGGRTEVFGNPYDDEIMLHYDWSGMYAECMCEKVLGGELITSSSIIDIDYPGFYWIKFEQDLEIPILPVRRNKLMFMNGTFEGWYWFEEIILAMENGVKILEVKKTITAQYYDKFIEKFILINNKIREIGPIHKQIGKNNNNTFYGRLGMDPEKLNEEIITNIENKEYEKIVINNGIYVGMYKNEKSVSNVSISASITAKARIKLYKGIKEVIKEGGRILYTDTDSIVAAFKKNIYKSKLDRKIGEVIFDSSKEDTIILDAVFAMPKTYGIVYKNKKEIVKIKGFNNVPDFKQFKKSFYEKSFIETENIEWNKKDLLIKKLKVTKKTYLNELNKRKWKEDLKSTEPLKE